MKKSIIVEMKSGHVYIVSHYTREENGLKGEYREILPDGEVGERKSNFFALSGIKTMLTVEHRK